MVIARVPLGLLAAIAHTSLASAAEPVNVSSAELDVFCHSPIADGGYQVKIRPGVFADTARVSVGADSRVGVHFTDTYDVSVAPSGSGILFQGRHLTLTLSEGRPRPGYRIEYDASLSAEYGGRTIRDRLVCSPPQ
jgi:hypothetical protein